MSNKRILSRIILPSNVVANIEADLVTIPGTEGVFGVLPDHSNLVSTIKPGIVNIKSSMEEHNYFVYGGIARVNDEGLSIVTNYAVNIRKIDKTEINDSIGDIKGKMMGLDKDSVEHDILIDKMKCYQLLASFL
jgi:F-type H+-transporting ATPase subunit epsilon